MMRLAAQHRVLMCTPPGQATHRPAGGFLCQSRNCRSSISRSSNSARPAHRRQEVPQSGVTCMARPTVDPETLESEIAQLRDLDITELRKRWQKHYGRSAPKTFRRNLLIRGLAYQMRVEVYGGLSAATK